jgi:3-methyladenine DNA glycosylase/8-oxoguanine DNA glycosylase
MSKVLQLAHKHAIELYPQAPFHFDATVHKPDHFPSPDNAWQPGVRWQTMLWRGQPLGCKFEECGTLDQPRMALSVWSAEPLAPPFLDSLAVEISYRFSLALDLGAFNVRFACDPQLGPIIARWRGMRPLNCNALYEYLLIAIVLQNAVIRRSVNMLRTLFEHYGTLLAYDNQALYCFWEPQVLQTVAEQELRDLKLGYRAKSIQRVSAAFAEGQIDEYALRAASQEEQRRTLLALYGIGPASVWYILFDVFHHLDELNHISPWEQKIYSKLFYNVDPDQPVSTDTLLQLFEERFGAYKMLAVHYVWEDLFWRWQNEPVEWLQKLIRR